MAGANIPSQLGRTAVVTGATSGLGYETARVLAEAGSEVILTGRDDQKGLQAVASVSREVTGAHVHYEQLDLASLASVAEFVKRMRVSRQSLDLLINNAGVMALPRRQVTADGFEMPFGTNHLGHFALAARLMPLLRQANGPRVVSVSSLAHRSAERFPGGPMEHPRYLGGDGMQYLRSLADVGNRREGCCNHGREQRDR